MEKLKVAVVGIGEQANDNLIPCIILSEFASLVSICDINDQILEKAKYKYSPINIYKYFEDMLEKEKIDVVVISSTPQVHFRVSELCIKKGIHFFVEKPPVVLLKDLKYLIDLKSNLNIKSGVGMNFSYTHAQNFIENKIKNKESEFLLNVSIEHLSSKPKTPFWSLDSVLKSFMLAQLIHPLDYLLRLCGKYKKIEIMNTFNSKSLYLQLCFEFESGCIGIIRTSNTSPCFKHQIEVLTADNELITIKDLKTIELLNDKIKDDFGSQSKRVKEIHDHSPLTNGFQITGYQNILNQFFCSIIGDYEFDHSIESMIYTYETMEYIEKYIENVHQNKLEYAVI